MIRKNTNHSQLQATSLSVCGPSRRNNQDDVYHDIGQFVSPGKRLEQLGLFIVCDGIGGLHSGELASRSAISNIVSSLTSGLSRSLVGNGQLDAKTIHRRIKEAVSDANAHLYERAKDVAGAKGQMGTTITLALVYGDVAYMANVGDSRIYLLRRNYAAQITHDHSLAAELARQGHIEPHEIADHPRSNVLSRALGVDSDLEVDLYEIDLAPGDRLLLCSDGLWKAFPNKDELSQLLVPGGNLETQIRRIVSEAVQRDGSDNTSAVLVSFDSKPAHREQGAHRLRVNGSSRDHHYSGSESMAPHRRRHAPREPGKAKTQQY
jgi:serine/threonine protein phosphatase PrpC